MGKRELLLICGFVLLGTIAYYATAPAPVPGQQGFSVSRFLDGIKREVHGNRSSAELTTTSTVALTSGISEIRFETGNAPLTISGEDRKDLECELHVWSNGFDETEAKKYASETTLKTTEAGVTMVIGVRYPEPASQRASLVVRMPKTLAVRIQSSRGQVEVSDVGSVELTEARGQVSVHDIAGRVTASHRGGKLTVESVAGLKLNTRGSTIALSEIRGEAVLQLQAGELKGDSIKGPLEIESNGTRIILEDLEDMRTPIRVNATGGSVTMKGLQTETRIDGRDTRIDVALEKAVSLSIYNEAEEKTDVTLPETGFKLDALTSDGKLEVPTELAEVKSLDNEHRATAVVGGGGPTITLRTSRGDLTIKTVKE